ncbi:MAG TPA: choline/ethanolamine kinase family protein [Anaerolineales bacterium]|nr:choline/ethanolamine kinase family protein [Anaerolineales bacterium]
MTDITDVIKAVPAWAGQPIRTEPVTGGLTNRSFRVQVGPRAYFVSIPGERSELLAIPRADEIHNTMAAAETGISPRVLQHLPDSGTMIVEFIHGRTLTPADMHAPGMIERLASAVRQLHTARPFANSFDLFRLTDAYRQVLAADKLALPEGFQGYLRLLAEMRSAAETHPSPVRPCSNDLVPENLIDDGRRLWIVDFGYSGNNDPCSELGNAVCEAPYDRPEAEALCAAYFGEASPRLLGRMQLYAVMSDVAWSLWSVIQERISRLEVDFRAYGQKRWDRARGLLDSDELHHWIRTARD